MIKLITGKKGSGKTKILIDLINDTVKDTLGDLVCIEKGANVRRSISLKVRWCDADEFVIDSFESFYGYIAGLISGNYDIKEIFVDGIFRICGRDYDALGALLKKLDALTTKNDITVVFTVSADDSELPASVTDYIK